MTEFFKNLLDIIKTMLAHKVKIKVPLVKKKTAYIRNKAILQFASLEIGQKEVQGSGNNKQVVKYHAYAREDNDLKKGLNDSVPWCASFIAYILEANPYIKMTSTNKLNARSYLKWGLSSKRRPVAGDIVVFWRGSISGWQGHVGFYLNETDKYIYVLGGNQSGSVSVSRYAKSRMLDIRRSSRMEPITKDQEDELYAMADALIKGKKIATGSKVH
jgi:uncharacterized protein (TIGR02594 family)